MGIRSEVNPFIAITLVVGAVIVLLCRLKGVSWTFSVVPSSVIVLIFVSYFLYFFRDPERNPPEGTNLILAAADGEVALIKEMKEDKHMNCETVRISIFLSLFSVHVNRAPIAGGSKFLGYVPGKHYFTFEEKSSDHNQHNAILIENDKTKCLIYQIVGPVCRRVVYWPDHDAVVDLKAGDKIGMMKFGSRLDMYFPKDDIDIIAKVGDKVAAGETVIAKLREDK